MKRLKTSETNQSHEEKQSNPYLKEVLKLKKTIKNWDCLFSADAERRMEDWIRIDVLGQPLLEKYAWAIPTPEALNVMRKFSPIVEIGAGKGYWSYLLQRYGCSVLPYDINPPKESWTKVRKGTPQTLLNLKGKGCKGLTLFLCYPDEADSVALPCLEHIVSSQDAESNNESAFSDYILHVGELIHTGCASGSPQSPWGRSSSPDFQVKLSEFYHCVASVPLVSFPFSRDYLTVWKRTKILSMVDEVVEGEEEAEKDEWKDIPKSEALMSSALWAPGYADLFL
eukprot:CAMPEP_0185021082 /NCGR_PEP_ID=MMETSP1103-20130426/3744_1 /TAXON_ID=36769 /ORGANISM="Paraphysomonas bandaiensis, Strain Caron Lab Isolate" /LENGTH=282 /DNA_ID=CAMNT_0027552379 /DNA_START=23 /DNA_END=871 /DNA_ORIENTATION=+